MRSNGLSPIDQAQPSFVMDSKANNVRLRAVAIAAVALLALLGTGAAITPGPLLGEEAILMALENMRTPERTAFMGALTFWGGFQGMGILATALVLLTAWRARPLWMPATAALLLSALTNAGLKLLIGRPRPSIVSAEGAPHGLSFPSGHSQASMTFVLVLMWVWPALWRRQPGSAAATPPAIYGLFLFPLLIGATRMYLGVHYPTDVIGGFSLAFLVVTATRHAFETKESSAG